MLRNIVSPAVLVAILTSTAFAQWKVDGVKVSMGAAPDGVERRWVASDGLDGIILTWRKNVALNNSDIFVQRVDGGGVPMWTAGGIPVCTAANNQFESTVVTDGAEGAIVVWQDNRSGQLDVYAQRVDAAGNPQWASNGVALCTAPSWQADVQAVPDGGGGAIVTWIDARNSSTYPDTNVVDIYVQRVNAAGVVQWTPNGVGVCVGSHYKEGPAVAADGFTGGAFIAWADGRSGTQIYAQYLPGGLPLWTANGLPVSTGSSYKAFPRIAFDGVNGLYVAWTDRRNGIEYDVYARRMDPLGPPWWGTDVALCNASGDQILTDIDFNPTTQTARAVWIDRRSGFGQEDVYAQSVDVNGVIQWGAGGAAICTAPGSQVCYQVAHNFALPEALFAWHDGRSGGTDIYAQKANAGGAVQWMANGVAVCTATGNQSVAGLVTDGTGGVVAAWNDLRSGTLEEYVGRVGASGMAYSFTVNTTAEDYVTGTLWEAITQANATPGPQVIRFDIPGPGPHKIQALCLPFPPITDELTIDGFTQPGASPNTNPVGSPSNAQIKIEISGPDAGLGWNGLTFQAPGVLRGVAISGFSISILVESPDVVIEGNYIGTNVTGLLIGPHQATLGVSIGSDNCRVGGSSPAARNIISGNFRGVYVLGGGNTEIYGNYIGVAGDAVTPMANEIGGILLQGGAHSTRVGSANAGEGNVIAYNDYGIEIEHPITVDNRVQGNSIHHSLMGIDLGADGITINDFLDFDAGPNYLQNFPDLFSASGHEVSGVMHGAWNQFINLDFYRSQQSYASCNAEIYMGQMLVSTNGGGDAPFTFTPAQPIPPASYIVATATDANGNTSELSFCIYSENTPPGSSVPVDLVDASGNVRGTATYGDVTASGNTFVANPFTPPVPVSANFTVGNPNDPSIYFDVTTDASYTGGVDVCLFYDEGNLPGPEANLVLAHYNGSTWEDVTTTRDAVNNKICGHVTTLSPFVIAVLTPTGIGDAPVPTSFALHPNVPNPFNPVTTIRYDVPAGGADVSITIYDVAGRMVRELVDEHRGAGTWSVQWNGDDDRGARVASGVYFYLMRAGEFVDTKKMVLLK